MSGEGASPADASPVVSRLGAGINLLLDRLQDAALVADAATGRIRLWNPAAEARFGYTPAEALALHVDALVPAPLRPRLQAELAHLTTAEHGRHIEHHHAIELLTCTKDGAVHPVELILTSLDEQASTARYILLIARDRSNQTQTADEQPATALAFDHARLDQSLSLNERRYRLFVQQATDVIAVIGPDGLLRYASPSVEKVLGYKPESVIGIRTSSLVHPEDSDWVREVAQNVVQEPGPSRQIEVRLQHLDGSWRTAEVSVTNLLNDAAVQGIVVNLHDITERKRSEEDERFLSDAGAILATSLDFDTTVSQLLDLAVPHLGDWCVIDVIGEDGSIQRTAVACPDPVIAHALEELPQYAPIGQGSSHPVAVALRTGAPVVLANFSKEMARTARSAEHVVRLRAIRTGSLIAVPLILHGRRLGVMSFGYVESGRGHDQREQSLAQRFADRATLAIRSATLYHEAQAALAEVQRALNLRDEFLSVASHELRTPLTALKGQIQLADRRLRRGQYDAVPTLIDHADAQVDRLTRLVRDLLDVSRIGGGGITMEFQPVALGALVQHVIDLERAAAPGRQITLDLPLTTPTIDADAQRIEQVLFNLLQNARKYSAPDTAIQVAVRVPEDVVTIAVTDHGEGIPADELPRIFERFHRARNVDRNIAGLGLGLYITREIVQAHGGDLAVESTVGRGSTFTVTLPWSAEPE